MKFDHISFRDGADITEVDLRGIEERYSVQFSEEYRTFMLTHNGGEITPNGFDFEKISDSSTVRYFYSINHKAEYRNLLKIFEIFVDSGRLPPNLMPIGTDDFGNLICISTRGDNTFGCIYFWDHEMEGSKKAISSLAVSFNTFLERIYEI
jgi:hypothetical protein